MFIRKLRTFCRLSGAERRLALKSILVVAFVRLSLWVLPFRKLQPVCTRLGRARQGMRRGAGAQEIARAVRLAGRYVPRATCLVQALAAQILLARYGHEGQVHIGVARDAANGLRAHAWL